MFWIVLFLAQAAVPSQTERGEALFFDAQQGCGTCHALKGKGTAVGPDLTGLGRLGPQAIAMAARSTVTQYVQGVKLRPGGLEPFYPGAAGPPGDCHGRPLHRDAVRAGGEAEGRWQLPGDVGEEGRQDRGAVRPFQESQI